MNYEKAVRNTREELKSYIQDNGLKSLVIGVSGGIDSALCIFLAKPVCEELGIKLIGLSLPSDSNKENEITRARKVGGLCNNFSEIKIDSYAECSLNGLMGDGDSIEEKIRRGNIKARIRMIILYDVAQDEKGMVLSTDNYTEYLLGFWTLHGDVGDYGMIQSLWKTEVYEMSAWLVNNELKDNEMFKDRLGDCIDAVPTDGLGITDSDLDQIGASSYAEVDKILKKKIGKNINQDPDSPVTKRMIATEFKRDNPVNISRDIIEQE